MDNLTAIDVEIKEENIVNSDEECRTIVSESDDPGGISDENLDENLAEDIGESITGARLRCRSEKSVAVYEKAYTKFLKWKENNDITKVISEDMLLAYFCYLSKTFKPNSLWSTFSMLKKTLKLHHKIDIDHYLEVKAYLKHENTGQSRKLSKFFCPKDIKKFLTEAPDERWLVIKVAIIFGLLGSLRRTELWGVALEDITEEGSCYLVNIPDTKSDEPRSFAITGLLYDISRKYMNLRVADFLPEHFFLKYQNGKCHRQNIGVHSFGAMPKNVAKFLGLSEPHLFTGHAFRLSSTKIYAMIGASRWDLRNKRFFKSSKFAEGFDEVMKIKRKRICDDIVSVIFNWDFPEQVSRKSKAPKVAEEEEIVEEQEVEEIPQEISQAPVVEQDEGNTIVIEDNQSWQHLITKIAESREIVEIIFE